MTEGGRELIAADESAVVAKLSLDSIVVEDGQRDGGLSDSAGANESDWGEVIHKASDLIDQLVAPEKGPRWLRWRFTGGSGFKYEILDPLVVSLTDPV